MDTSAVLNHHAQAISEGSADEVLKDYADDAVMITPDAVIKGRAAIHAFFSAAFSGLLKPGTYASTLDAMHIDGEIAYITWRLSGATADVTMGTDTFAVRDGKIVAQTWAVKIDPK